MFDYIKGCILDKLKTLFTLNYDMHSNITHSYEVLNIPKINARRFLNYTLSFDGFILNC